MGVIQDRSAEAPSNSSARSDKVLSDDEVDMLETTIDAGGDESQLNENDIGAPESNADDMEADDNIDADPEGNSRNQEEGMIVVLPCPWRCSQWDQWPRKNQRSTLCLR